MKNTLPFLGKKGSVRDVLFIIAIVFVFGIAFLIIHFTASTMVDNMLNVPQINASSEVRSNLEGINTAMDRLDYIILAVFVGLTIGLLITGWLVGGHPIFMAIYFVVVVFAVIISAFMANVWEDVSVASVLGTTVNSFPVTNHLLLNLPLYAAIIGGLGLIAMFAKPFIQGGQ
jgi:hypothetical protein